MRKIMACLDVGNDTIKLVVGEHMKSRFNVLASSCVNTLGLVKNNIINEEDLSNSIIKAFKEVEDKLGQKVNKVLVIVSSINAELIVGEASIKIGGETPTVKASNVSKVLSESLSGCLQDNMELVNVIPMYFTLEDGSKSVNPKGALSKSLSVKSIVVAAPKQSVYKILSVLDKLNKDIVDISFDVIGDYFNIKQSKYDKTNGAIINLGYAKSTIAVFSKGILTNVSQVDLGGVNIEHDISYIYKVNREVAKDLMHKFAFASSKLSSNSDIIEVLDVNSKKIMINHNEISQVVESRIKEILKTIKKELNTVTKKKINYIIVTGGVSEMPDFNLVLESVFNKDADIMKINDFGVRNNKYSSALGLIKWYNSVQELKGKDYSIFSLEQQEKFSGLEKLESNTDDSIIGKVFGYFFD